MMMMTDDEEKEVTAAAGCYSSGGNDVVDDDDDDDDVEVADLIMSSSSVASNKTNLQQQQQEEEEKHHDDDNDDDVNNNNATTTTTTSTTKEEEQPNNNNTIDDDEQPLLQPPSAAVASAAEEEEEKEKDVVDDDVYGKEKVDDDTTTTTPPTSSSSLLVLPTIFKDHFTLPYPSSVVRFRSNKTATRVYENRNSSQFILEETEETYTCGESESSERNNRKKKRRMTTMIRVKLLNESTKNLQFLRATYCIVTIFWTGILFVFCLQVLLTIVLEVAVQYGTITNLNTKFNFFGFIGTLFALYQFCVGFAHGMVIATAFVIDVWSGHTLIKKTFATKRLNETVVDWCFFGCFILMPTLVFCITIYINANNWWTITGLFWFSSIALFYIIFAISSIYFEIKNAIDLVADHDRVGLDRLFDALKQCAYLKLIHIYSGIQKTKYFAHSRKSVYQIFGDDGRKVDNEDDAMIVEEEGGVVENSRQEKYGCCTCITRWGCLKRGDNRDGDGGGVSIPSENHNDDDDDDSGWFPIFKHLDPPRRIYSIDDFQEYRPFITKNTWGLERLYCRSRNSRYVAIVNGPGAVTSDQMKSSIACSFIAMVLYLLILTAVLVFFGFSAFMIVVIAIIYIILMYSAIKDNLTLIKLITTYVKSDISKKTDDDEGINEALHLVTEYRRVTEPTDGFCWAMMVLRLLLFFLFPAVMLFLTDNKFVAWMFLIIASISNLRYYVDVVVVIEENENMGSVRGRTAEQRRDDQSWEDQSRLSGVIEAISYDKSKRVWLVIMAGFGVLLFAILTGAIGGGISQADETKTSRLKLIPASEFHYPPQPMDVRYQTCNLSRDLFGDNATLADFAFMSLIAYHSPENIVDELNEWFGDGVVVSERDTVDEWFSGSTYDSSTVSFQLFNYTQMGKGVISIRGTQNPWDLLTDAQLWSTAALCQFLRLLLPVGEMWTPLLDDLVQAINILQSESLNRVAYYKTTTAFAKDLKNSNAYQSLQLTGHSLGGGLAIISGAQSTIPAVALSGPNAKLSGSSFTPKVTHAQLDQYTFNIIPAMDPVARFDDVATQYQNIRCLAEPSQFMECHSSTRSLCEILYTCGSGNRPLYCSCVTELKYPKPLSYPGARDFNEVCPPAIDES